MMRLRLRMLVPVLVQWLVSLIIKLCHRIMIIMRLTYLCLCLIMLMH